MTERQTGIAPIQKKHDVYRSAPYSRTESGIPLFIPQGEDDYIANYDKIAKTHLMSLDSHGINPFMSGETWSDIDNSTLAHLRKLVKPGDVMLDAGVGLGALLRAFPDNARYGVDVSLDYLERTKEAGIEVSMAKLEELPYKDSSFDLVLSTDVLEHVVDFYAASREIVRVLKSGGYLVIRVPLEEDMKVYYEYKEFDYVHLRRFDIWSLRIQFEKIFKMQFIDYDPVLPLYRGVETCRMIPSSDGEAIRNIIEELPDSVVGKSELRQFSALTPEMLNHFMNNIASNYVDTFKALTPIVAKELEVNMVFRKS